MACSGEDILNIDIDSDLLIGLVGKLSLNNIPDFSETLLCLDDNATTATDASSVPLLYDIPLLHQTLESSCTGGSLSNSNKNTSHVPLQCDILSSDHPSENGSKSSLNLNNSTSYVPLQCEKFPSLDILVESSCSSSSSNLNNSSSPGPSRCRLSPFDHSARSSSNLCRLNKNQSKDGFLSSIGLVSSPRTQKAQNSNSSQSDTYDDSSNSCDSSTFVAMKRKESYQAEQKPAKSKKKYHKNVFDLSDDGTFDYSEDGTFDKTESPWNNIPFFAGANYPHKMVNNLHDVFAAGGLVYDIDLADMDNPETLRLFGVHVDANDTTSKKDSNAAKDTKYDTLKHNSVSYEDLNDSSSKHFITYDDSNDSTSEHNFAVYGSTSRHLDRRANDATSRHAYEDTNGSTSKHVFRTYDDSNDATSSSFDHDSCEAVSLPQSENLVEKSLCSPDSGISTSPCPGPVSPLSPTPGALSPLSPRQDSRSPFSPQTDDSEDYDDGQYEDDLQILLAELIEIENSLKSSETPQSSNAKVPVLRDSKSAEDHKERIMHFLKEPIFNDLMSQLSQLRGEDERPRFPELVLDNTAESDCKGLSKATKKPSPRSKKHKLGMEFKCAVKNELRRHSSIFSKGKHLSSRSKILKQIQGDERIQEQMKVIQKLIVSKKFKRMESDDRENKKRRVHFPEPQEDLGYEQC